MKLHYKEPMPYIKQKDRDTLDAGERGPITAGELNYVLSQIVKEFLPHQPSYACYNDVLGVLECLKLELYRRMIAPYEDTKIRENGDVFNRETGLPLIAGPTVKEL